MHEVEIGRQLHPDIAQKAASQYIDGKHQSNAEGYKECLPTIGSREAPHKSGSKHHQVQPIAGGLYVEYRPTTLQKDHTAGLLQQRTVEITCGRMVGRIGIFTP